MLGGGILYSDFAGIEDFNRVHTALHFRKRIKLVDRDFIGKVCRISKIEVWFIFFYITIMIIFTFHTFFSIP